MENSVFKRIKSEHPNWSDEQIWAAVSLELQSQTLIEREGGDVNPNDELLMTAILEGAKKWLEEALPIVYEKVAEFFGKLLANIGTWVKQGMEYVIKLISKWI